MDNEKLIDLVKKNAVLYDSNNKNYCDNFVKDKLWMSIAKQLNVTVPMCRSRWNSLRDQWRRNKKKQFSKTGAVSTSSKPWRYEEEMSFLLPFLRQRERRKQLSKVDETEFMLDEELSSQEASQSNSEEYIYIAKVASDFDAAGNNETLGGSNQLRGVSNIKSSETVAAPSMVMNSLIESRQDTEQVRRPDVVNPLDSFFDVIKEKVKRFTPYYRNVAENKIFTLVQQMELEQILQSQQEAVPLNPVPRQNHPEEYCHSSLMYEASPSSPAASSSSPAEDVKTFQYDTASGND